MLVIGTGKGGSGKSKTGTFIAARAAQRGKPLQLYDGDVSNGTMRRLCGDRVQRIEIDDPDAMVHWLEHDVWPAASSGDAYVDLGSGAERIASRWLAEAGVLDVADEAGVPITFIHVLDASKDALVPAHAVFRQVDGRGRHLLVLNAGRLSPREQFEPLVTHEVFRTLVHGGAKVVELPRDHAAAELDRRNISILHALGKVQMPSGKEPLSPFDVQRARIWFRRALEAFEEVDEWLP